MGQSFIFVISTEGSMSLWQMVQALLALKGVLKSAENTYGDYSGLEEKAA